MPANNKPCHNCRRRRLRCDRSWPTCNKCTISGQECLGYGRVYVWTEGIDAHGKVKPSPGARRIPVGENHGVAGHPGLALRPPTNTPDRPPKDAGLDAGLDDPKSHGAYLAASQLTDPIFQDLDRNSRTYLAHCEWF